MSLVLLFPPAESPPALVALTDRWGVAVDTSIPDTVSVSFGVFTSEGPRLADALVDLITKLKNTNPGDAVWDRRWHLAYYQRKRIDYLILRAGIANGTYTLPSHQTQSEALAIVDAKMGRFMGITTAADAEDRS